MGSSARLTPGCCVGVGVGELSAQQQRGLWEAVPGSHLAAVGELTGQTLARHRHFWMWLSTCACLSQNHNSGSFPG